MINNALYIGSNKEKRLEASKILNGKKIEYTTQDNAKEKINTGKYDPIIIQLDLKSYDGLITHSKSRGLHTLTI